MDKILKVLKYDFYTCRKLITGLIVYFFLFGTFYGYMLHDVTVVPISIMIWFTMMAGLPFMLRDKYGLDNLQATFPINRKITIRSRYLFVFIIGVIGISLSELMVCILSGVFSVDFDIRVIYFHLCIVFLLYFLVMAVHMPLYFKFTHTLAVQLSPLFLFVIYVICIQLYYSVALTINAAPLIGLFWENSVAVLVCVLFLAAMMQYLSYRIACRIYFKKDL